jgi:hypothetical protein
VTPFTDVMVEDISTRLQHAMVTKNLWTSTCSRVAGAIPCVPQSSLVLHAIKGWNTWLTTKFTPATVAFPWEPLDYHAFVQPWWKVHVHCLAAQRHFMLRCIKGR